MSFPSNSLMRSFLAAETQTLTLFTSDESGQGGQLSGLVTRWLESLSPTHDSAATVLWPAADHFVHRVLAATGLQVSTVMAVQSAPIPAPPRTERFGIRRARPSDIEDIVRMRMEEIRFAEPYSGSRVLPETRGLLISEMTDALVSRPDCIWIAESSAGVSAVADCSVVDVTDQTVPRRLPPGRYGYINSFFVLPELRGAGLGSAVVRHAMAGLRELGAEGFYLWYNPLNPRSGVFWPRCGFRPLWQRWERRPASVGPLP